MADEAAIPRRGAGLRPVPDRKARAERRAKRARPGESASSKRGRQYEHIEKSQRQRGAPPKRAREIAARTVQKERARSGESRTRSRTSTRGASSSQRGGHRSGTNRPKGRTREQLYNEAKKLNVPGRSGMN